ncbi:ImmA/IrrE family metallo-endopeptidase [Saccharothrix hoggarensis]|uniref:ImmA/IrrE family metallo-endopeptidase n=1 Tax=Saccharothrix hoggarensis TaxID=913853 RepID=A0ABW3QND1_9PSEU
MSKWSVAHRLAQMAAARMRGDAGLDTAARADIPALLRAQGLVVQAEPADRLFGAYMPADPDLGIPGGVWLNGGLTLPGQRHTGAHELGHHALGHGASYDTDIAALAPPGTPLDFGESCAEAFAAWLLMPRAALQCALRAVAVRPGAPTAVEVYRVSLLLGTSYRGTARHLGVAHLIPDQDSGRLQRAVPGRLKDACDDPSAPPRDGRGEVWALADFTAAGDIVVADGDRLVLPAHAVAAADELVDTGHAEHVHHGLHHITLTARTRSTTPEPDPADGVEIHPDGPDGAGVRLRVQTPLRRTPPRETPPPDVSRLDEAELDRLLAGTRDH